MAKKGSASVSLGYLLMMAAVLVYINAGYSMLQYRRHV
jgi:hypothetical protein